MLSDTSGEKLHSVEDLHPAYPAETHCPAAILSAAFLHSFISPVPTDKAVTSPLTKLLHTESKQVLKSGMTSVGRVFFFAE